MSELVELNGAVVRAEVVELGEGLHVRFDPGDWGRLGLRPGVPVHVHRAGRRNAWVYLAQAVERLTAVWAVLARRVRAAG